jgi:hypothetical protein
VNEQIAEKVGIEAGRSVKTGAARNHIETRSKRKRREDMSMQSLVEILSEAVKGIQTVKLRTNQNL